MKDYRFCLKITDKIKVDKTGTFLQKFLANDILINNPKKPLGALFIKTQV